MIGQTMPCPTSFLTRRIITHTPTPKQYCSHNKWLAAVVQIIVLLLLISSSAVNVFSQATSTGTIVGTISDQQGAVVPDATIAITDKATSTTTKTTSNSAGHYAFPNVNPGTYDIKITKQGFQTAVIQGQSVQVG